MSELSTPIPQPAELAGYPEIIHLDRASVLLRLRLALKARSSWRWSVTAGAGLDAGRLTISAPPARLDGDGCMTPSDRVRLTALLGLAEPVGPHGCVIAESTNHYVEYVDRAEGRVPRVLGQTMPWDLE